MKEDFMGRGGVLRSWGELAIFLEGRVLGGSFFNAEARRTRSCRRGTGLDGF